MPRAVHSFVSWEGRGLEVAFGVCLPWLLQPHRHVLLSVHVSEWFVWDSNWTCSEFSFFFPAFQRSTLANIPSIMRLPMGKMDRKQWALQFAVYTGKASLRTYTYIRRYRHVIICVVTAGLWLKIRIFTYIWYIGPLLQKMASGGIEKGRASG